MRLPDAGRSILFNILRLLLTFAHSFAIVNINCMRSISKHQASRESKKAEGEWRKLKNSLKAKLCAARSKSNHNPTKSEDDRLRGRPNHESPSSVVWAIPGYSGGRIFSRTREILTQIPMPRARRQPCCPPARIWRRFCAMREPIEPQRDQAPHQFYRLQRRRQGELMPPPVTMQIPARP